MRTTAGRVRVAVSHPRRGIRAVGSVISLEIRGRVITARVAQTSIRRFEHPWREGGGGRPRARPPLAVMRRREQRGEFWASRLGQALRAEHKPIAHRLGQLAGARPGEAIALIMVALVRRRGVGLKLGGTRLRAARHFDLKRDEGFKNECFD